MDMQTTADPHATHRVPGRLDLAAGGLLLATIVLHVVAMFPTYVVGQPALASQSDQAALYAVLAAAWALALAVGLTGPHRTPMAAGLAVGVAVTELGFRVSDLGGYFFRYGNSTVGSGFWVMEAAWVVGAAAAGMAVIAARARHAPPKAAQPEAVAPAEPNPYGSDTADASIAPPAALAAENPPAAPVEVPAPETKPSDAGEDPQERLAWGMLITVLAIAVAGAFLPAWDHAVALSSVTGQSVSRSLGNAFNAPWQQVVGTVLAAVAMFLVPVAAMRLRDRAVAAAATVGSLLVLTTQLVAAVIQVDQPVPPGDLGIGPSQANQLGLHIGMQLTGWFTLDALVAYALFAAVIVRASLRVAQENSPGIRPSAPDWRSEAISWGP
jgi:hypothetical protein